MHRKHLNLVLAAVVVGLAVAVFFSQKTEEPGPPLTPMARGSLSRILIEHPGKDAIALEKSDNRWMLTAPVRALAEEIEVGSLTELATREVKDTFEAAEVDLAELRLDPPEYSITLDDTRIAFGRVEPLQYRRYVKIGDKVQLIEDPPSAALDEDYSDLVAKQLFTREPRRINVPGLSVVRGEDGTWAVDPENPDATADRIARFVDSWKNAKAMWNERKSDVKVKGEVTLSFDEGDPIRYIIDSRDPQLKLHRADLGITHVLSKALADELLKLPEPEAEPESGEPVESKGAELPAD